MLTVTANVPGSSTAGTPITGSLDFFTNDPAHPSGAVVLSATPSGATIALAPYSPSASKPTFAATSPGTPAHPITLSYINSGTAPATVTFGSPADPEFSLAGEGAGDAGAGVTLAAGDSVTLTAGFTPALATLAAASTSSTITVSGTTCGTSASSIQYSASVGHGQINGWPSAPVDFGPTRCGSAATDQTVVLTNGGSFDAHVTSAVITGASGFTGTAGGLRIPASGSASFTVHAPAVPTLSPVTPVTATLTVTTDAEATAHTITLTEEPSGAVLGFDTTGTANFGSFGPVVLLGAATQAFKVTNTGNAPATVTLSTGASGGGLAPFTISNPTFTIPANGTQTDAVTFSPTGPANSGAVTLVATGVLCAALPSPLPLTGAGIGGGPSVAPTSLTFPATCGAAAPAPQTFTMRNDGATNLTWSMSGLTGPGSAQYAVTASPPPGTLMPGQSSQVSVAAAAIPSPATNPSPSAYAAALTITTDVPFDGPHVVSLGETPLGDQLSLSVAGLKFGQFPIETSTVGQPFTVTNAANPGSPSANVSFTLSGAGAVAYAVSPSTITNLAPGGGVSEAENVMFRPTSAIAYPSTLAVKTSDSLCTPLPRMALGGTGTQGKVAVSNTGLTFGTDTSDANGLVNCGASGPAHTFTVSNTGNQQFQITGFAFGLGAGTPYALSGDVALPFTVPIGGVATITVTPKAIPSAVANPNDASAFTDTLTVTTNAALDVPHKIALVMQARGAVIAHTSPATSWDFGTLAGGVIGDFTTTITNTGNAAASVTFQGLSHATVFGLATSPVPVAANAVTDIVGQFTPPQVNQQWTDQGTLVVTPAQAFCEPLPTGWTNPTIHLSGASISGTLPVSVSGSMAFPLTDCGSAAPAAQSITLTNTTNLPYLFTAHLASGAFYTLQNPTMGDAGAGIIPGNGVVVLGVTPQTVTPGPAAVAGSAPYADDLVIAIQSQPPSGITIPISWTLNGAMLSLPQGAGPNHDAMGNAFYAADSNSGLDLPMDNAGTATASVQFGVQPAGAFSFSPAPPTAVQPGIRALPRLVSGATDATCPALTTGSATFLYSGPVCRPFPLAQVSIECCVGSF
jgi:P pilus assembly chaperone PapD